MILLHSIKTKKTLPIRMSRQDYDITRKILGDEFCCEFLVDTGITCGRAKRVTETYSMDAENMALWKVGRYLQRQIDEPEQRSMLKCTVYQRTYNKSWKCVGCSYGLAMIVWKMIPIAPYSSLFVPTLITNSLFHLVSIFIRMRYIRY